MTPAFRTWVEHARAVSIEAILAARAIELPGRGNRRAGPCPNCGGTDRFAVDLEKQLFNCRGCGGKGHGSIALEMFLGHCNFLQATESITGEPPPKDDGKKPAPRSKQPLGKLVGTYDYTDELEDVGYQVLRYDPKDFRQRRPDPDHPDEWLGNLDGVRLVPYRLPDVIEAIANGYPVYWVEGEKDADNGAKLGLVTTTTAMGVAGKGHWERGAYDEFFAGADVVLVPDQDPDPNKGKALAQAIGKRLKPIAASVRVLTLPVKDLSVWIEQGGSREAFDELPLDELVESNGHDHAEDGSGFAQDWQPPDGETIKAPVIVPIKRPFPIDAATLSVRPWEVPGFLLRGHVSVLVAPPGSGKSLLTLQIAIMMGLGTPWGGWHPRAAFKVLVINSEDDHDEMCRRLFAAVKTMECDQELLRDQIALADKPEDVIVAQANARTKQVIKTPMVENIIATIKDGGFDCVIIDPFAETFAGDENSNNDLKWAALAWREIARRANCAVLLVHHTRKYASASAGDMDAARGAGALVGVARVVSTVFTMTEPEAQAFEIDGEQRHRYLRFDDAKANLSLVTFKARWFEKRTYVLPNGSDDVPADEVGVLVPWKPRSVFDKVDVEIARTILLAIDKGIVVKNKPRLATDAGEMVAPVPDPYTLTRRGKTSARWAGNVVQEFVVCSDKDAQKLLNVWVKNGVLIEVAVVTSTSKGQARKGLKVVMAKLPGNATGEDNL